MNFRVDLLSANNLTEAGMKQKAFPLSTVIRQMSQFQIRRAAYEHIQNRQKCCIYIPVAVGKTMNKQPRDSKAASG